MTQNLFPLGWKGLYRLCLNSSLSLDMNVWSDDGWQAGVVLLCCGSGDWVSCACRSVNTCELAGVICWPDWACAGARLWACEMKALPRWHLRDVDMKITYLTKTNSHRRSQLEGVQQVLWCGAICSFTHLLFNMKQKLELDECTSNTKVNTDQRGYAILGLNAALNVTLVCSVMTYCISLTCFHVQSTQYFCPSKTPI